MARWRVDLVGKRVQRLGTVVAKTEREALEEVTKRFGVDPASQFFKIAVTKITERDK
jgi:hypothetical protein